LWALFMIFHAVRCRMRSATWLHWTRFWSDRNSKFYQVARFWSFCSYSPSSSFLFMFIVLCCAEAILLVSVLVRSHHIGRGLWTSCSNFMQRRSGKIG
jgi:hypothetical protein